MKITFTREEILQMLDGAIRRQFFGYEPELEDTYGLPYELSVKLTPPTTEEIKCVA